ncbi:MAG: hypothetical protein KDK90_13525 [Leptospiraceae bacterium]|nr:hypothetical protein [Leptospiraceae bacterium]
MKIIKQFLIVFFLFLIYGTLIANDKSLNQKELRTKHKLQLSVLSLPYYSLNFQYHLGSKISLGSNLFYYDRREAMQSDVYFSENDYLIASENNINIRHKKLDKRKTIAQFHLKFFPFEKFPLYFIAGINRDFRGENYRFEYWGNFLVSQNQLIPYYSVTYTHDLKPGYFGNVGLGFQWIFQKRYFIGCEVQSYYPIKRKENEHLYSGVRSIPSLDQRGYDEIIGANLIKILMNSDKGLLMNSHTKNQLPEILLWIGYAF